MLVIKVKVPRFLYGDAYSLQLHSTALYCRQATGKNEEQKVERRLCYSGAW